MKNVEVNGITYNGISNVQMNTTNGKTATFVDSDELTETITGRVLHVIGASEVTALQLFNSTGGQITSAQSIGIANKNIFRADLIPARTESQGITVTNNGDGSFTANGTSTGAYAGVSVGLDFNPFQVGQAYTISSGKTSGYLYLQLIVNYKDGTTDYLVARNSPRTFTITKPVQSVVGSIQINDAGITLKNERIWPQVEVAGAASSFEKNTYTSMSYNGSTMPTLPAGVANVWPLIADVATMSMTYRMAVTLKTTHVSEQAEAAFSVLNSKADKEDYYSKDELDERAITETEVDSLFTYTDPEDLPALDLTAMSKAEVSQIVADARKAVFNR